jgi:hypothetical protein
LAYDCHIISLHVCSATGEYYRQKLQQFLKKVYKENVRVCPEELESYVVDEL